MTNQPASVEASTLDAMSPDMAGLSEVAEILGVTKRTATNYVRREDFPAPTQQLAATPLWRRRDVEAWAKRNPPLTSGRRPQKPPA